MNILACPMCKTAERNDKYCPNCGNFYLIDNELDLIYGESYRRRVEVRLSLTDRYIIIHRNKGMERSSNGFGIIGGAIVSSVVLTAREGKLAYGFYGIDEIREIVYPYRNSKFKKNRALKVVFKDGSDFILRDLIEDRLKLMYLRLAKCGVTVIDGKTLNCGDRFCDKPFVTPETVGVRVCASAARVIKMMPDNFAVEPIGTTSAQPKIQLQQQPQTYQSQSHQQATACQPPKESTAPNTHKGDILTVSELNLTVMAYNGLRRAGISEIGDLVTRTREELKLCGINDACILEIQTRLAANGLSLAGVAAKPSQEATAGYQTSQSETPKRDPDVKFCRKCGAKLRRSDVFCIECGADQR